MCYPSKYENGALGPLRRGKVTLERACRHCETTGPFQTGLLWIDTQIM